LHPPPVLKKFQFSALTVLVAIMST
jgi:hypothetical protein